MAMFSVNQVRNLYVATEVKDNLEALAANDSKVGAITVGGVTDKEFYFQHKGHGGIVRSDLVKVDSVMCIKHVPAKNLGNDLYKATVTLSDDVNGGEIISGQDYILRIVLRQFAGMSDEDTYIKYGAVHGTSAMKPSDFYKKMAISLAKNFSRELTKLLSFELSDGTEVTAMTKESELTGNYTSLVIKEVPQEWTLGVKAQEPVYFDVYPTTVTFDGDEMIWGEINEDTGRVELEKYDTLPNSKKIADLEYFCHGERGDIYRNVGWPDVIPTKYIADGEDADGYDILEIHFAYKGGAENPQLSEKDIEIAAKKDVMTALISKIKAVATDLDVIEIEEKK